jgi:hypothetical protein
MFSNLMPGAVLVVVVIIFRVSGANIWLHPPRNQPALPSLRQRAESTVGEGIGRPAAAKQDSYQMGVSSRQCGSSFQDDTAMYIRGAGCCIMRMIDRRISVSLSWLVIRSNSMGLVVALKAAA